MASGGNRSVQGSYVGSGVAQNIEVGFKPRRVEIYRMATRYDKAEHLEGMTAATHLLDKGDDGVRSLVGANGITLGTHYFTAGTDASVNANGDSYRFVAHD